MLDSSVSTCGGGAAGATVAAALQFFAASQCLIEEPWPKTAKVQNGCHFDFIIVGAGTAGSTLAARLAQLDQFSVLLVEAGGYPPEDAIIPGFRDSLKNSPYDWKFTTENDAFSSQGLNYGKQVQPRGKLLGGTGSINDMVYSRGFPQDYYEWASIAGETWNWTNVLEYFKKTINMADERIISDRELMSFHGLDGEIEISGRKENDFVTSKFLEAFNELGFDLVDDMTYPGKIGAGKFSHTIKRGRRHSSLTALLNNIKTANLHVLNDTFVTKILIENNTAIGIRAISNGEEIEFYANKEVILSAGTFNTPKIMMLSGIGPKEHIGELGIEVVQNLPVGENLHDHVMVINYLIIENSTCPLEKSAMYLEMIKYLYNSSGTFSYSDSMGVYLPKSGCEANTPHFAIYPTCMSASYLTLEACLEILGFNETVCHKILKANQKHELISLPVVLLKPKSRGKVRLSSTDPLRDPLIYSGTFNNPVDYEGYHEAIKKALSLVNTSYFKKQGARVLDYMWEKCSEIEDKEEQTRCFVRDYAMPAWHAVGTAAMGTVVDFDLRVKGVDGLRVVDASVIPVIIRGNTNAVIIMIAEKAADFIKNAYYRK